MTGTRATAKRLAWFPSAADESLVRVGQGDSAAFEAVFDLLCPRLVHVAWAISLDRATAEEVAQETMIEVWRHASRFDPSKGNAIMWASKIARRRAIDRVRSTQSSRRRDESYRRQDLPPIDEIGTGLEIREEVARVRDAMSLLTGPQLQAVTLAYYGGHTYCQVAAELQIPLGTAKSRIRDALTHLAKTLQST